MLRRLLNHFVDPQYRRPSGVLGRYIGGQMVEQHAPENDWTIELVNAGPQDRILEIGFGAGYAIERLARIVTQGLIAGADFSEAMVASTTRRNAAVISAGRVDLRLADVGKLPFESGAFNKAFSIHSIYFWTEPLKGLGEIMRVLQPGGMLVITLLPKTAPNETGNNNFRPYSGVELIAMLHVGGFRGMTIRDGRTATCKSNYSVIGYKPAFTSARSAV